MSWRIATEHRSRYTYAEPVVTSFNEARISPASSRGQSVIDSSISVSPSTPLFTYVDYWGTLVVAFDVTVPHTELEVVGSSIVETPSLPAEGVALGWEELARDEVQDQFAELLLPTPYTEANDALVAVARSLSESASPRETLDAVGEWVRGALSYVAGSTQVSTSALEAWRQSSGVCQDFAHLSLALLRQAGIPCRYVSGYLHPDESAEIGVPVAGQSHAWVEAWLGSWIGTDPTNGLPVDERHVCVARGRDYADVAPFRGVYHGGALERLEVSVTLTRVA